MRYVCTHRALHGCRPSAAEAATYLLRQDARPVSATRVGRRRAIDGVLTDCLQHLLQHIDRLGSREVHVTRSHHTHVSVVTVAGGLDVPGSRAPVHVRHPKPTTHHEAYASDPVLRCAFPANGQHSALHGEAAQQIRKQHSIVLRAAESRRGRRSVDDTTALPRVPSALPWGDLPFFSA